MPTHKEQFVSSIQSVIQSVDDVTGRLAQTRRLCEQILSDLQDESKLGAFSEFDFGKEELEKEGKKIHTEIQKKLDAIEKQIRALYTPMKQEQARTAAKMTDRVDSPKPEK